jgi:hypothetical protein
MRPPAPCWRRRFSPQRYWNSVPPRQVQAAVRAIFTRWGRPQQMRVDNGTPWGPGGDLPPALALWLRGLHVGVLWNRPARPQDNARVERSQGVLQRWVDAPQCTDGGMLQRRLGAAVQLQREQYPACGEQSRLAAYPGLAGGGAPYSMAQEAHCWERAAVDGWLEQGLWTRRVDKSGQISLYNWTYRVGKAYAGQVVQVRYVGRTQSWVVRDEQGVELLVQQAPELSTARIESLTVARGRARRRAAEGANRSDAAGVYPYVV